MGRLAKAKRRLKKWRERRTKAKAKVKKLVALVKRLRSRRPRIVTAAEMGLAFSNRFGELGPERYVTGHHTAGPTDRDLDDAIRLCRQYHNQHASYHWGGAGYHYCVTRGGVILGLRPVRLKGAHVGGYNSENVGIMFHGTTGDKPTTAQRRAYKWLLANAHTRRMPAAHRTELDLRQARRRGHNDWPGHKSNACPGTHKPMILKGG